MDCQKCSLHPATVFMTTVVGDDVKRLDLCAECAQKAGAIHPSGFLAEEALLQEMGPQETPQLTCAACGYPLESLQKTGRLGCATCYERFAESLAGALTETQKGLLHQGKRPARKNASAQVWAEELKHFVAVEDFEGAARVRDEMAAKKAATPRRPKTE